MMGPSLKIRGWAASTKRDLRNFREPQAAIRTIRGKSAVHRRRSAGVDSRSIPVEILAARPTL